MFEKRLQEDIVMGVTIYMVISWIIFSLTKAALYWSWKAYYDEYNDLNLIFHLLKIIEGYWREI